MTCKTELLERELFDHLTVRKQMNDIKLLQLHNNTWNHLTVCKQMISFFLIIKGFRIIVFIFIVISTTFRPICPPAFFRCLSNSGTFTELRTTSFIESTGVACSDSVTLCRTHSVTIIGVGSLSFYGDNHLEVAGSILTAGE